MSLSHSRDHAPKDVSRVGLRTASQRILKECVVGRRDPGVEGSLILSGAVFIQGTGSWGP